MIKRICSSSEYTELIESIGVNAIHQYKQPLIFFILFVVVLTLPSTIRFAESYIQTERISRDVGTALNEHYKGKDIIIKNIWLRGYVSFLPGGGGTKYGFDYFSDGKWREFECSDGGKERLIFSLEENFSCYPDLDQNYLVYDDVSKKMVYHDILNSGQDYVMKVSIMSDFEEGILLIYTLFIMALALIISFVWMLIIYMTNRRKKRTL